MTKVTYNKESDGSTRIECSDGSSYSADHVICTVSLGVLKEKHLTLFDPLLPRWKIDCIDGLKIGTVNKIYLEYDKPFWDGVFPELCMLWRQEELKEIRNDPINGEWLEAIMGFYPVTHQPKIIIAWIAGELARKMELVSDADVKNGAEKVLRLLVKKESDVTATSMIW